MKVSITDISEGGGTGGVTCKIGSILTAPAHESFVARCTCLLRVKRARAFNSFSAILRRHERLHLHGLFGGERGNLIARLHSRKFSR